MRLVRDKGLFILHLSPHTSEMVNLPPEYILIFDTYGSNDIKILLLFE